jgi:squalene/oxidosqualene cyclase-like protein
MNANQHVSIPDSQLLDSGLAQGIDWLIRTQEADGSWPGNYGGPMFLLPLYILTAVIINEPIDEPTRSGMIRYIRAHQRHDGGFGLHVEGESCVYGTVTNYVGLRLLGVSANDPDVVRARNWLHQNGGPLGSASWGKFFLALIDLYPFEALNPLAPELWLLPESLPFHPSKMWCHCRMVYLPMSYLYRKRCKYDNKELIEQLRHELYPQGYDQVPWEKGRSTVHTTDMLVPRTSLGRFVNQLLTSFEEKYPDSLKEKALNYVLHQVDREDKNTNYICIGPINKLLNTLVWYFEDSTGPELRAHRPRMKDYLFEAPDGILMQGYNSSRLWDTAFTVQALLSVVDHSTPGIGPSLEAAARFVDNNQVNIDVFDNDSAFRHRSKGGWPFSDQPHGWPISDCTAEGLKASLLLLEAQRNGSLPKNEWLLGEQGIGSRLKDAAQLILSMQNEDGGWATYELRRGPKWLEQLNPSDCFREIMVDYSYVECTSACMQALAAYSSEYPNDQKFEIRSALSKGLEYLLNQQRSDGSFEGAWGVCFTYGTWFAVNGLRAAKLPTSDPAYQHAVEFLEAKQRSDGGWGESIKNCLTRSYDPDTESQVVMTSWAVMALLACGRAKSPSVTRAIVFLLDRRLPDGTYPEENIAGVFNKTCAIHYDNYLKIFPVWALGLYRKMAQSHGELATAIHKQGSN